LSPEANAKPSEFADLWSKDRDLQNAAFYSVIDATDQPVAWAYDVWDEVVSNLKHEDNHNRAIAAQVLCNLAKSDPDSRILSDFEYLLEVTRDHRFVTARHCLQSLWKIGIAGNDQLDLFLRGLRNRFLECVDEKNSTLIRHDILKALRDVYDISGDSSIKDTAHTLIQTENDPKGRAKYRTLWKNALPSDA
jgi:hypothetical protein